MSKTPNIWQKIYKELLEENCFCSHDIVSLFTNTTVTGAPEVIRQRLVRDKTLQKHIKFEVDDVMEVLKFVLMTTYFIF